MLHNILTGYRKHTAADLHNKYSEYNTFIQHMSAIQTIFVKNTTMKLLQFKNVC